MGSLRLKIKNSIRNRLGKGKKGREKKFIFYPTVASDGKVGRAKKFCRGFAHSISGLLIHRDAEKGYLLGKL
jgi:hypothetical protein